MPFKCGKLIKVQSDDNADDDDDDVSVAVVGFVGTWRWWLIVIVVGDVIPFRKHLHLIRLARQHPEDNNRSGGVAGKKLTPKIHDRFTEGAVDTVGICNFNIYDILCLAF